MSPDIAGCPPGVTANLRAPLSEAAQNLAECIPTSKRYLSRPFGNAGLVSSEYNADSHDRIFHSQEAFRFFPQSRSSWPVFGVVRLCCAHQCFQWLGDCAT